jgi:putative DNA methylase
LEGNWKKNVPGEVAGIECPRKSLKKIMTHRRLKHRTPETVSTCRLIETDAFPFEFLSALAERESWRKELYRPIYHVHKWWANRLGSVFRGIILGCLTSEDGDLQESFYGQKVFPNASIFDPFMGSGTTLGEAHKLGCIALGRDINSVACESVRVALGPLDENDLTTAFEILSATVGERIRDLYRITDERGRRCEVLYHFWIKQVSCPNCHLSVDLFPSRIFARNAQPRRSSEVQVCCPRCGDVFPARKEDSRVHCRSCKHSFNPHLGYASGKKATCPSCLTDFSIVEAVRSTNDPPKHRHYAKLLLLPDGSKRYQPANEEDRRRYQECTDLLQSELEKGNIRLPVTDLNEGYNTRQALGYNYRFWRDFFNDRQLLALGWLQNAIAALSDVVVRDALLTLFSGVLEFNCLFTSYKGEGTGAVRHMFSHHILKPERMPIEANVWGTPKSSGSFRNLFYNRMIRAIHYREDPFEVKSRGPGKVFIGAQPFSGHVETRWPRSEPLVSREIYLSCGSSDETNLPDQSVDLIVTDPPFFDNVHYSELADFFHAWQILYPRGLVGKQTTTRHAREVQDASPKMFAEKLFKVYSECHRVLKCGGLLVFTYHHSRPEGWTSLASAIIDAGFSVVKAHPVKAEMSVAAPKFQAKEPIQLDIIFVCRKKDEDSRTPLDPKDILALAYKETRQKLARLAKLGLSLSQNDCRIVAISQFLSLLGPVGSVDIVIDAIVQFQENLEKHVLSLVGSLKEFTDRSKKNREENQLTLFSYSE